MNYTLGEYYFGKYCQASIFVIVFINTLFFANIFCCQCIFDSQAHTFYPSALRAGGVLSSRSGRAGGRAGGLAGGRAGGRAGGCQTCGTHISVTAWWIFSVRSSMELFRPVVVHCHAHLPICPFAPYGLADGPKTCQICHKLDPDFADRISLKPLDGFTPFKVSWTCLDL